MLNQGVTSTVDIGDGEETSRAHRNAVAHGTPDPVDRLEPAIETLSPAVVAQGSPTTTLTLTGFNFVRRSRVYVDGLAVPYRRISATELGLDIEENFLKRAGRFDVVVRNPAPLDDAPGATARPTSRI